MQKPGLQLQQGLAPNLAGLLRRTVRGKHSSSRTCGAVCVCEERQAREASAGGEAGLDSKHSSTSVEICMCVCCEDKKRGWRAWVDDDEPSGSGGEPSGSKRQKGEAEERFEVEEEESNSVWSLVESSCSSWYIINTPDQEPDQEKPAEKLTRKAQKKACATMRCTDKKRKDEERMMTRVPTKDQS